jgi:hypothetical protein
MRRGLLVLALSLAACTASYIKPAGQVARLRIVYPSHFALAPLQAVGYATGTCSSGMELGVIGGLYDSTDEKLGMVSPNPYEPDSFTEREIPSGQPYLVTARAMIGLRQCAVALSFTPFPDTDYELVYKGTPYNCRVELNVLNRAGSSPRTPAPFRIEQPCFF